MRGNENLCVKGYDGLIVGRECLLLHQPNVFWLKQKTNQMMMMKQHQPKVASSTKHSFDAELQLLSCCGQTCDCCSS